VSNGVKQGIKQQVEGLVKVDAGEVLGDCGLYGYLMWRVAVRLAWLRNKS